MIRKVVSYLLASALIVGLMPHSALQANPIKASAQEAAFLWEFGTKKIKGMPTTAQENKRATKNLTKVGIACGAIVAAGSGALALRYISKSNSKKSSNNNETTNTSNKPADTSKTDTSDKKPDTPPTLQELKSGIAQESDIAKIRATIDDITTHYETTEQDRLELTTLAIQKGAPATSQDLSDAILRGDSSIVTYLVSIDPTIVNLNHNEQAHYMPSPLKKALFQYEQSQDAALKEKYLAIIKKLLGSNAYVVDLQNQINASPDSELKQLLFDYAFYCPDPSPEAVKDVIDQLTDKEKIQSLIGIILAKQKLAERDKLEIIKFAVQKGATITRDYLYSALGNGDAAIVEYLVVQNKELVNLKSKENRALSPLATALNQYKAHKTGPKKDNYLAIIKVLLENDAYTSDTMRQEKVLNDPELAEILRDIELKPKPAQPTPQPKPAPAPAAAQTAAKPVQVPTAPVAQSGKKNTPKNRNPKKKSPKELKRYSLSE